MSVRVSFADLLKKGAEKDQKKIDEKPKLPLVDSNNTATPLTLPTPATQRTPPTVATKRTQATPLTSDVNSPVSPERDFAKVANSIVREAVAQGLFIGKSKQIYDFLYLQTRGSIQPARNVRITKSNLMRGSDIGSERTLLKNLSHLKAVGLIKIREFDGQHGGNEYEVFLPEEFPPTPPTALTARQSHYAPQKVGTLPSVESGVGGVSQIQINKDTYSDAKTSLKTNTKNDDEPFGKMNETLAKVFEKVSGKRPQKSDAAKLNELAELLAMELEIAAARTKSISNVPAFLTEHLRRRLLGSSARSAEGKLKTSKSIKVGKSEKIVEEYQAEPLSKEAREAVLKTMSEYIKKGQLEFVMSQQDTYTKDDWDWLMHQLEKE